LFFFNRPKSSNGSGDIIIWKLISDFTPICMCETSVEIDVNPHDLPDALH
jgi:hypothetical protein